MPVNLDELKNATNLRGRGARSGIVFVAPVHGKAHVSGERKVPLLEETIPALFSDTVSKYGTLDAAIFVGQDKRFTWSELSDTVDALAAGFLALGLRKGDRVGIWSPNRWEWLVTQFATARIG
ncbi:AMP-binding protein, partial [Mesorhizobium sp. M2D.F.Ca.ET.145.01.1.1]